MNATRLTPEPMLIKVAAGVLLALALWALFRLAMALRWAKAEREAARRSEEGRGRRVVTEIPLAQDVVLFLQDDERLYWSGQQVRRAEIAGARLLLNGGIIAAFNRNGFRLPDPPPPEEFEGRERWDVMLYLEGGADRVVRCGEVREGVSREAAARVFEAARRGAKGGPTNAPRVDRASSSHSGPGRRAGPRAD